MNIELAKELKHSTLWKEFVKELEKEVEIAKEKLVSMDMPERYLKIQAEIITLRRVIRKPDDIIDEGTPSD